MRPLIVAILFSSTFASAYPISPQTIWELTWKSELIVVAQIDDVGSKHFSRNDWASYAAELRPLEVWKGSTEDEIEVVFARDMVCPAPPRYEEGRVVLAFLRKVDGDWHTTGLSYGTRYFESDAEIAEYREAVNDAIRAQARLAAPPGKEGEPRTPAAERGWALARAGHRATRWDGLYSLSINSDPHLSHYDHERERTRISDLERERLAEIFLRAPSFDQTLVMMLKLLEEDSNPDITRVAAEAFETVMANEVAPWWADEAIEAIRNRLTKARHQLEPARRPDYRKKKPSGTGGDTPL